MANILDNLLGIFNSKKDEAAKKGKYFLELNEADDPKPSQIIAKVEEAASQVGDAVSKAVDAVKPQVQEVASQVGDNVSKAVDAVKPQVQEVASQVGDNVSKAVDAVKPQVQDVKSQVQEVASELGDTVSKAVDSVKPQVDAAADRVAGKASEVADKGKKGKRPSIKDKATKKQETASANNSQPAAAPAKAAKPPEPEITTFAPNYLNTAFINTSRRRPGPSLNAFKTMAKDVGTPKRK